MNQTAELFVEVFSEEIPAGMQVKAATGLEQLLTKALKEAGLTFGSASSHSTPRHLAVVIPELETIQADRSEEKKGPKVGAPEQAVAGFLKANGLASIDEAEQRETPKGTFYFAVKSIKGQKTADLLPDLIQNALTSLSWPKSMRWGRSTFRSARPVHSVVAVFGGEIVPGDLPLSDDKVLAFGDATQGHRFLSPEPFKVQSFKDYASKLKDHKVILDRADREALIQDGLEKLAAEKGLTPIEDAGLLEEIVGLVEWPVPLMGRIDDAFMDVPMEVLVTSMREHQKFFAFKDATGKLAPYFATVANTEPKDGGDLIRAGNERVLRARLSDAKFFWDQDKKTPLPSNVPALSKIVFHAKLGTVGDKIDRMGPLASEVASRIGGDRDKARSAARLCKADLVSSMVYEFPELQGTMGRYYALHDQESPEVANAIAEHYSPLGPSDDCPSAPVSVSVAIADKLDTLVGFWLIDEKPTGSKDPFALRRAALGIARLITENDHSIALKALIQHATQAYGERAQGKDISQDLWGFFKDRVKVMLRDQGIRHDVIEALYAAEDDDDLTRLFAKTRSLSAALDTDEGKAMVAGYKRACNILAAEEKKDGATIVGDVDQALLQDEAEIALFDAMSQHLGTATAALEAGTYEQAYASIALLRPSIDAFFADVTVNADDSAIRHNRLRLLASLRTAVQSVADLSKLEG